MADYNNLVPDGVYHMRIESCRKYVSQGGNDMIKCRLRWVGTDRDFYWFLTPVMECWHELTGYPTWPHDGWRLVTSKLLGREFAFTIEQHTYQKTTRSVVRPPIAEIIEGETTNG